MDEGGQTDGDGKWSSAQFKALPVPLMRWVMGNRMHDDEIMWLADYALEQKSKGNNYLILADAYSDNSTKREAYLKALDYQKINVDSMEGLINTYKADSSTTSTDYFNLSKRIIDTYTYYPQAMVEFLNIY